MAKTINFIDIWRSLGGTRLKLTKSVDYCLGGALAFLLPEAYQRKEAPAIVSRVLIIRPGGIGDAVFLLPVLKLLKEKNIQVDMLCESRNVEVFCSQGHLLNNIYLDHKLGDVCKVLSSRYDVIVDTEQWHYLTAVFAYFMRAHFTIGFSTRPLRAKLFSKAVKYEEHAYELINFQRLFDFCLGSAQGINTIDSSFDIPQEALAWAKVQIPQASIAIFMGASITARRLTESMNLELIQFSLSQGLDVVLLGGKDVEVDACRVMKITADPRVHNFVGKASLLESAALIKVSRLFIGGDSGLMHLACAIGGVPVMAVFGPGDKEKWSPRGGGVKVFSINAPCSPCTKFGYTVPVCKGTYFCMKDIVVKDIRDEIKVFLGDRR